MEWKAPYGEPDKGGTIFNNGIVCIHRIVGIPNRFYLTCHKLGIAQYDLKEGDFDKAIDNAKSIISKEIDKLNKEVDDFLIEDTPTTFSRY